MKQWTLEEQMGVSEKRLLALKNQPEAIEKGRTTPEK
jgi:hypothetical protein